MMLRRMMMMVVEVWMRIENLFWLSLSLALQGWVPLVGLRGVMVLVDDVSGIEYPKYLKRRMYEGHAQAVERNSIVVQHETVL